MLAFDLIGLLDPEFAPERAKLHLATWNGLEDPLALFRAGRFEPWQAWQNNRNFEREFVVALIAMPGRGRWLYGGAYDRRGFEVRKGRRATGFVYDLAPRPGSEELKGRLVCGFERSGRQSCLRAEAWAGSITVVELLAERLSVEDFPGFKGVNITKVELDAIVRHQAASWRAALSSVGGVYLITDEQAGLLYVGSAYGEGGFWQRWSGYAANGHGGNRELRRLVREEGPERLAAFRYSILETADIAAKPEDIIRREAHWKVVLGSRAHGLNAN